MVDEATEPDSSVDPELGMLVDFANRGLSISITVYAGGQPISGRLVSGAVWAAWMAEKLDGRGEGAAEGTGSKLAKIFKGIENEWIETWIADNAPGTDPVHYHLETAAGTIWRGRLEAVSAWCLGEVS